MTFQRIQGSYPSSNGDNRIAYTVYLPEGEIKAILQIAHGMAEHFGRYEEFAGHMAEQGVLVCGNDHLGHGRTAENADDLGYFGGYKGWVHMVDDMHLLTRRIKETYGEMPYFLLGHSMGSLLSRAYLTCYGNELSGAILMGTSGKNKLTKLALPIVNTIGALKGERHRSLLIYSIAFGGFTKRYEKGASRLAWMSRDPAVLAAFKDDPKCNFVLTVAGFRDLMNVLTFVSRKEWAKEVPKGLPVYLVSGSMDPVGEYGKGVQHVYKDLLKARVKDLRMKLYPDARHEILNEPEKNTVYQDLQDWLIKHL